MRILRLSEMDECEVLLELLNQLHKSSVSAEDCANSDCVFEMNCIGETDHSIKIPDELFRVVGHPAQYALSAAPRHAST